MNKDIIKLSAITGRLDDPSSYFRLQQYFAFLEANNIVVTEFKHPCVKCKYPAFLKVHPYFRALRKSSVSDVILISRVLVEGYGTLEWFFKHPQIMDVDDAIWLRPPFGRIAVPAIASKMDAVIAGNTYLAEYFSKYCKRIFILPTAIDTTRFHAAEETFQDKFIICWTGLSSNFKYLDMIAEPLAKFIREHADTEIKIIADKPWHHADIESERVKFVQWTRADEASELQNISVGIMPLNDSLWTRGKCSFKMLQYMATAKPVIVSPVGMNRDIMQMGNIGIAAENNVQWYEAFCEMYKQRSKLSQLGLAGRKIVEANFATNIIGDKLLKIIKSMV